MGTYVTAEKNMKFKDISSLQNIVNIISEADAGLRNKARKISDSPISEVFGGVAGIGMGAGLGFAALYFGGTVGLGAAGITSGLAAAGSLIGGGMVAGIGVLAAPAVVLGGVGVGVISHLKNKKLREAKEIVYKDALAKQQAILNALKEESNADKARIDYLNSLNILLQAAIKDLRYDLGYADEA